ncbi:uncharacterized protein BJ171DRAFT_559034 [Polychytrium aggregatum]|uniref:uncharacterized protein n=1 Tax=Polychytrium aggregatum TaxID=110093 RepID=UPI0022FDF333|nr:uncharacterized protein BJ171DRAFT_559034 [Polychytrium aggregatum]KAI9202632.1 hypothetical protein BJ171DRAFT_559034 [Polychytrium aggregatum]
MVSPLKNANFRLVFASRFMFQMGIATVQQFLQYWIGDCVSVDMSPSRAVSIALIPLLTLSPLGALAIPKSRRKVVVYAAAALMALSCVLMIVTTYFYAALAVSGIFGLGYGPFLSVEFAMLMDVLPSKDDAARDISLWHTALVLPQIVASPIAGWVRDGFQPLGTQWDVQCLGYKVMFSVCLLYFLAGVGITRRIAGIH